MLDDLRNSASTSYEDEVPPEQQPGEGIPDLPKAERPPFLGMSAQQRFVIVLLMVIMACILGTLCLVVTEKVWLPFF